jgi:dolichol kinase
MRSHEVDKKYTLNGASWVFISAVVCIFIFPKLIAVTGFSILIISDASAALYGKKFGKHKLFTKSWEGTGAFFVSSFIVVGVVGILVSAPWTYFLFGALGGLAAGFSEAASSVMKLDDNLSIPVSFGLIAWGGFYLCEMWNLPLYLHLLV